MASRVLIAAILLTWLAFAQSPLGTVTGIAIDPSGAPIPNIKVTLINQNTGVRQDAETNQAGLYSFPNLPAASYKLTAEAPGFRQFETVPFEVQAYRTVRQDLRFEVATATTEITVSESAATILQLDTPAVSQSLSRKQLLELPTNLRSVYNNAGDSGLTAQIMPLTVPGVVQVGAGASWLIPGGRANGLKLRVDGIDTTFGNFGLPDPVSQPSMESVQEFSANVATTRAEFGGQGTVTTVTRSGTNEFHADIFYYVRNSFLDARNPFLNAKQFQNIHNYGITGGGPIVKNRTFGFFTFDGIRGIRSYPFPPITASVPPAAYREGDFSSLLPNTRIRNPFDPGAFFENNIIPRSLMSPQALRAQQLFFPMPTSGGTGANYRAAYNGPETHSIVEARIDHTFEERHTAFLRYQWKKSDFRIPGARSQLPPTSVGTSTNIRRVNFFTLGDVFTLRPNVINEFRAGVVILVSQSDADVTGQGLLEQIGIQGLPDRTGVRGIPNFNIAGFSPVTQILLNPVNDGHWQVSDNITWVSGKHSFKFGGEYVNWFVNRYVTTNPALFGNYSFSTRYTGAAYGDFLLGLPTSVTRLDPWPTQYNRWFDWAIFAQDDWRVTPRLTLNYGLRYEYNDPVRAKNGNIYSFDTASGSVVVPDAQSRNLFSPYFPSSIPVKTASEVGLPENLRSADRNNFAPRFGFSYQLDKDARTVLRGGWGVYYGHFSGTVAGYLSGGPYSFSTLINNGTTTPNFTLANPFASAGAAGSVALNSISPNLRNNYSMQYTLTIERELSRDLGVRVSYIGTKGSQLVYQRNINQPPPSATPFVQARRPYPQYANILMADNGANSFYNGLQTTLFKRFSRGFLFNSSWTWAKELSEIDDTGDAELNTVIENAYDRRRDRANVYSVPRHQWMNNLIWELPFGGRNPILGGWQINALINVATGNWLNPVFAGVDPSNTAVIGGRPDVVGELNYPRTLAQWFDQRAFAAPPANSGRFGTAGRNIIQGPGYIVANVGLTKNFNFERGGRVQIGVSFQNAMNHLNYGQPTAGGNPTPNGQSVLAVGTNAGLIAGSHIFPPAGSPRTGLLHLRWSF
jgi:hypothetical protein